MGLDLGMLVLASTSEADCIAYRRSKHAALNWCILMDQGVKVKVRKGPKGSAEIVEGKELITFT